jgi:hypothetical protein
MKNLNFLFVLFFSIIFLNSSYSQSEDEMALMGPAPQHELLKKLDGKWDIKFKLNFDVTAEGTGSAESKMILGGRFLQWEQRSEAMGMKFGAMNILGFDRRINKYTIYGIDELGTYAVTGEGDYDAGKKILTLSGKTLDPSGKSGAQQEYKFIYDFSTENTVVMQVIFKMADGSEKAIVEASMKKM